MRPRALVLVGLAALACDPVHDQAIAALGGEAPGVPKGPLHRPGQPCLLCHDGNIGNPPAFTVAGTIYVDAGDLTPAVGAQVQLTDSQGNQAAKTTNAAGNFYLLPHEFRPVYPMKVTVAYDNATVKMTADIGRDGSCAKCHSDPPGPASAGHVYIPPGGVAP